MAEDKKKVWPLVERAFEQRMLESIRGGSSFSVNELMGNQLRALEVIRGDVISRLYPLMQGSQSSVSGISTAEEWKQAMRVNVLSLFAEASEILESTPWKPWRKAHVEGGMSMDEVQECKLEVVDAMCFMMNIWLLLGGTAAELGVLHEVKCDENIRRAKGTY